MAISNDEIKRQILEGLPGGKVLGQPEQQAIIIEQPDGKRFIYPATALAVISDQVLANIAQTTATLTARIIFAELEARGIIPHVEPPADEPAAPEAAAAQEPKQ